MRKQKTYMKPRQAQEIKDNILLRKEDIKAMIADGSIEHEHFLIKLLARNMAEKELV